MTVVIRGTAEFRKRVRAQPLADGEGATGDLGEWFANVRLWRPHLAIFVHARTYLPVLIGLSPATSVIERFGAQLDAMLLELGAPAESVARQQAHRSDMRIAASNDRSVVGVMNEYVKMVDWWRHDLGGINEHNTLSVSLRLASTPVRAGSQQATWPDRAVLDLLEG